MKLDGPDRDNSWREIHVFSPCFLRPSQKALIKHFLFELKHCQASVATVSISLDRVKNVFVEVRKVLNTPVVTILAFSILDTIMDAFAAAALYHEEEDI